MLCSATHELYGEPCSQYCVYYCFFVNSVDTDSQTQMHTISMTLRQHVGATMIDIMAAVAPLLRLAF